MNTTTFNGLNSSHVSADHASGRRGGLGGSLAELGRQLRTWRNRSRERIELAHMTDLDLSDIGLSRADAEIEAGKPFWRA